MRPLSALLVFVMCSLSLSAQDSPPPQTARQALIEMFFGSAPDHLEKHLPTITRRSFQKFATADGPSLLAEISAIAAQAKAAGPALQTFDTGPTVLSVEDPHSNVGQKVEITLQRDDLLGDEDQIEVELHVSRNGKDETIPFIPRFTFLMKTEHDMKTDRDVWRLQEISATVRAPLTDPDFLKTIEEHQRKQNEQMVIWSLRSVVTAEKSYQAAHGSFACALSALGSSHPQTSRSASAYLYDRELIAGKKYSYIYVISSCDGSHYKIAAEPATGDSELRAFCGDDAGAIRGSADGKAASCLSRGEIVDEKNSVEGATGIGIELP